MSKATPQHRATLPRWPNDWQSETSINITNIVDSDLLCCYRYEVLYIVWMITGPVSQERPWRNTWNLTIRVWLWGRILPETITILHQAFRDYLLICLISIRLIHSLFQASYKSKLNWLCSVVSLFSDIVCALTNSNENDLKNEDELRNKDKLKMKTTSKMKTN